MLKQPDSIPVTHHKIWQIAGPMILANILILYSRKFYNQYTFLEDAEIKIFSQNGEDGILDYIITQKFMRINSINIFMPNRV